MTFSMVVPIFDTWVVAFGRQVDSFEADIECAGMDGGPFHCVFIRAPAVNRTGDGVKTLAALPDGRPVAVTQGRLLATAFHPELTDDARFHELFAAMAAGGRCG